MTRLDSRNLQNTVEDDKLTRLKEREVKTEPVVCNQIKCLLTRLGDTSFEIRADLEIYRLVPSPNTLVSRSVNCRYWGSSDRTGRPTYSR